MKLADEIVIVVGREEFVLHPSLRLALQLERRPGGFAKLIAEIADGSLTTACELIGPHDPLPSMLREGRVMDAGLTALTPALLEYVFALAGVDPEAMTNAKAQPIGKTVPIGVHLKDLYRIGTGWLGWSPETTLDATPVEIMEAFKGRQELLKAIFGGKEDKPRDDRPLDQKVRSIFAGIGTVKEAV